MGARVRGLRFADHHVFSRKERARATDEAGRDRRRLIVTEKDWQRLPPDFPAVVARLDLKWDGEDPWDSVIASALR